MSENLINCPVFSVSELSNVRIYYFIKIKHHLFSIFVLSSCNVNFYFWTLYIVNLPVCARISLIFTYFRPILKNEFRNLPTHIRNPLLFENFMSLNLNLPYLDKYMKGCEAEGFESPQVRKRKYLDSLYDVTPGVKFSKFRHHHCIPRPKISQNAQFQICGPLRWKFMVTLWRHALKFCEFCVPAWRHGTKLDPSLPLWYTLWYSILAPKTKLTNHGVAFKIQNLITNHGVTFKFQNSKNT